MNAVPSPASDKPTVVIVSAYGRGHWLAVELVAAGFQVDLVDVSECLGRWSPEDIEGPFGYFQPDGLLPSQRARLDEEDYSENIEEGFVLWLKSGPIDMRGSHSAYLLERRGVPKEVLDYVSLYPEWTPKQRAEQLKKMRDFNFQKKWLAQLAHSLASRVFLPSTQALNSGSPLPLAAPLAIRRVTRRGFEKSLTWMRGRGVRVFEKAKLKDIAIDQGQIVNIEIESDWSGVLHADQFLWSLTSLETQRIGAQFFFELYNDRALQPEWVWQRFRVDLQAGTRVESLPLKWVMIEDLSLPWTHSNLIMCQKTVAKDSVDAWVRVPYVQRFQKLYMEQVGREICELFQGRIPGAQPKIVEMPAEHHYDESTLGPALYFCQEVGSQGQLKPRQIKNLRFDGPEVSERQDWTGRLGVQNRLLAELSQWKVDRDKKLEKLRAKEAAQ